MLIPHATPRRPRHYLSRREQWRVLRLVMLLGLVAFLMYEVRQPKAIRTLSMFFGEAADDTNAPISSLASARGQLDSQKSLSNQLPNFSANLLENVRDNSPFRHEESEAWNSILDSLAAIDGPQANVIRGESVEPIQLLQQPSQYRGEWVSLTGTIRQAISVPRPEADEGKPASYYRMVLSVTGSPIGVTVFALELPASIELGDNIDQQAQVDGVFFKNWLYEASGELLVSPVLLSRTIFATAGTTSPPSPEEAGAPSEYGPVQFGLTACAALIAATLLTLFAIRQSKAVNSPEVAAVLSASRVPSTNDS